MVGVFYFLLSLRVLCNSLRLFLVMRIFDGFCVCVDFDE